MSEENTVPRALSELLQQANRALRERATARARASGFGLRPAHTALLRHIGADGVRVGVLAQRAGLTKQAVSPLLDDLARAGIVVESADPADRRAARVSFTKRGIEALGGGLDVHAALDEALAAALGEQRVQRLRQDLSDVLTILSDQD